MKTKVLYLNNQRSGYDIDQCPPTMTVGQLRRYLEQYSDDTLVYIRNDGGFTYSQVNECTMCNTTVFKDSATFTADDIDAMILDLDIDKSQWGVSFDLEKDHSLTFYLTKRDAQTGEEVYVPIGNDCYEFSSKELNEAENPIEYINKKLSDYIRSMT